MTSACEGRGPKPLEILILGEFVASSSAWPTVLACRVLTNQTQGGLTMVGNSSGPQLQRAYALLGRISLYGAMSAIPAWFGCWRVLALKSDSSGAPFMFAMFFLPAMVLSTLGVVGGCTASFLLRNEAHGHARLIALTGATVSVATVLAIPLFLMVLARIE